MSDKSKAILTKANAAITAKDHEGFLAFCTDDIEWTMVGGTTISGKQALREWLAAEYREPPQFTVSDLIAEGDFLCALGDISLKNQDGKVVHYSYCDVWRFRGDKMAQLKAYVVKT